MTPEGSFRNRKLSKWLFSFPFRRFYFKCWPLEKMISFSLFSDQDMYSSEKIWAADSGLFSDRDSLQGHFQSWVSVHLCLISGASGAFVEYSKRRKSLLWDRLELCHFNRDCIIWFSPVVHLSLLEQGDPFWCFIYLEKLDVLRKSVSLISWLI